MALGPDTRKNSLSARGPSTHDLGINNADNFRIGKRLANLPKTREIGFAANRWLLEVERLSHEMHSRRGRINRSITLNGQRASGFRSANMRNHLAALSGRTPATIGHGANDLFIFAAYAPTARSSASPAVTAIASPTPVSEQPSTSREPIIACCAPPWPSYCPVITPPPLCSSGLSHSRHPHHRMTRPNQLGRPNLTHSREIPFLKQT